MNSVWNKSGKVKKRELYHIAWSDQILNSEKKHNPERVYFLFFTIDINQLGFALIITSYSYLLWMKPLRGKQTGWNQ